MHTKEQTEQSKIIFASFKAYTLGFLISIILTLAAFIPVILHIASPRPVFSSLNLTIWIVLLAFIQLWIQLLFFLHLGRESKPRWNLIFFLATAGIIFLVVIGSIWIIDHLNYNMTPTQVNNYIIQEEGVHK